MSIEKTLARLNANARRYGREKITQKALGELMGQNDNGVGVNRAKGKNVARRMRAHLIALEMISDADQLHVLRRRIEGDE